jgi:hypothetical protein
MKLTFLFILFSLQLAAQDSLLLSNEFEFNDGIYATFDALKANRPTYTWAQVEASAHLNKDKYIVQFQRIERLDTALQQRIVLQQNDFWGVCVNGVPYIRIVDTATALPKFVGLRTRGRIAYFYYETEAKEKVPMIIYDPRTQQPVWREVIENKKSITQYQILHFENGEILNFDKQNLQKWLKPDAALSETLRDIDAAATDKLYKILLIFNDRNPFFMPQGG